VQLIIIGLGAGLLGGMLGVGGSIIMIPAMTEVLGPDQHLYQAAAMIVNFFVVVPAVYQHRRAGAIDRATVARLVPLAVLAVLVGVGVSELPIFAGDREAYLRGVFGAFLLIAGAYELHRLFAGTGADVLGATGGSGIPAISWRRAALVAVPSGLVAGLLGVGGGLMAVPLQRRFLRIPMRTAIANSAAVIIATSLIGASAKNYAYLAEHDYGMRSFILAAVLVPTAMIGGFNGSKLTHRLPVRTIKSAFLILMVLAGVRLMYKASQSISDPGPAAQLLRYDAACTIAERRVQLEVVQL
jgi:uncharacterized membrane protein YfcA